MIDVPDVNAWASLFHLLSPFEYFVTVDHSVLWQRHVAWSKPKGSDLRQYITQRYASNQVFLSLMLGAELGVLFNSSRETSEMRSLMSEQAYGDLRYWIGLVLLLDSCVTVLAIVTNFTLWGMISAISDTNTHCLLRSSIGQYVICLPPRFIVAALYLFLLWLLLWFVELLRGPMQWLVVVGVMVLFFQVVIPLSAFGRLIIHTGAMAKRRVLDEELEKDLLPSGLHASLLIRATDRRRKYTSAVHQYTGRKKPRRSDAQSRGTYDDSRSIFRKAITESSVSHHRNTDSLNMDSELEKQIERAANLLVGDVNAKGMPKPSGHRPPKPSKKTHHRVASTDSADFNFPRASILNSTRSQALREVVEKTLSSINDSDTEQMDNSATYLGGEAPPAGMRSASPSIPPMTIAFEKDQFGDSLTELASPRMRRSPSVSVGFRKSFLGRGLTRQSASRHVQDEWQIEADVRNDYNVSPPAELLPDDDSSMEDVVAETIQTPKNSLRASVLNRAWGLASLREFVSSETMDTPDSSVGGNDDDSSDEENGKQQSKQDVETSRLLPSGGSKSYSTSKHKSSNSSGSHVRFDSK